MAIKKIPLNPQSIKLLTSEIHIMRKCSHENVINYHESFRDGNQLWVVMEYIDGGCLTSILEEFEHVQMDESSIAWVCKQVIYC